MTTPIVPQPTMTATVTPALVLMASTLIKLAHPANPALHRAIDKCDRLHTQPWAYDGATGVLAITSTSQPNVIRYASPDSCDCPSPAGCWHKAAAIICQTVAASGIAPLAPLPLLDPAYVLEHADNDDGYEWLDEAEEPAAWADGRYGACQACGKPFTLRSLNPLCHLCDEQPEPAPPPVFRPVGMPKRVTISRPNSVYAAVAELV